mgnify:FL=1
MPSLEVFFDYICPFCLRGHKHLLEVLPDYPEVRVLWKPCESHPRPERYGPHSDLCIQGFFFAADHGADLLKYHERMYELAQKRRADIEDIDALAGNVADLLDAEALRRALADGRYRELQQAANDYAYERNGVWAVPAYRMDGRKLDSIEGIGVTKGQIRRFLEQAE